MVLRSELCVAFLLFWVSLAKRQFYECIPFRRWLRHFIASFLVWVAWGEWRQWGWEANPRGPERCEGGGGLASCGSCSLQWGSEWHESVFGLPDAHQQSLHICHLHLRHGQTSSNSSPQTLQKPFKTYFSASRFEHDRNDVPTKSAHALRWYAISLWNKQNYIITQK